MKKILLSILIFLYGKNFLFANKILFNNLTFITKQNIKFTNQNFLEKSFYKYQLGFQLDLETIDFRFFTGSKNVFFSSSQNFFQNFFDLEKTRFSLHYILKENTLLFLPFDIKFSLGNLSYSDSISFLSKPISSSLDALKKNNITYLGFRVSPQSIDSSKKDFSISINSNYFDFSFIPKETLYFSIKKEYFLKNKNLLGLSLTTINYLSEEKTKDTWFLEKEFFPKDKMFGINTSAFFENKIVNTSLNLGIIENPFGTPFHFLKNNLYLDFNIFSINFNTFFSNPKLITISNTKPKINFLLNINPQINIKIEKINFEAGFLYQIKNHKNYGKNNSEYINHSFKIDFLIESKNCHILSENLINYSIMESYKFSNKIEFCKKNINNQFYSSLKYSYEDKNNKIESVFQIRPNLNHLEKIKFQYDFVQGSKTNSNTFQISSQFLQKKKKILIKYNFSINYVLK